MKLQTQIVLCIIFTLQVQIIFAQTMYVSGFVKDAKTGESLINAHIYNTVSKTGTISNAYGFFSLPIKDNTVDLLVSYIGYVEMHLNVVCRKDTFVTFKLESENELQEITIKSGRKSLHSASHSTGNVLLSKKELESIPGLMGEKDVLKSLQTLPGIQRGREGTSGLIVRGGETGHNLILLDGVPVYNINHLFNFFSVFTPEAIKSVDLYKGGFPAGYSGRLSSVVDIRLKEGNLYYTNIDLSFGTIASKVLIEGPLVKGKSSYIISGRRTYFDLFFTPINYFITGNTDNESEKIWSGYYFYDFIAKANYIINPHNRIYISTYAGKDNLFVKQKEKIDATGAVNESEVKKHSTSYKNNWGNITASLRWNRIINEYLFANTTLVFSKYNYNYGIWYSSTEESAYEVTENKVSYRNLSGNSSTSLSIDFDYNRYQNLSFKFGLKSAANSYLPANQENHNSNSAGFKHHQSFINSEIKTVENTVYIENTFKTGIFSINAGVNGLLYIAPEFTDLYIQPRILMNMSFVNDFSLKASYTKMVQPVHLLVNNTSNMPVDIWVPAAKTFIPAVSHQFEFGIYKTLFKTIDWSSEIYYKKMRRILSYQNGESFFQLYDSWENKVTSGNANSYGFETLIKKSTGKSTGWIGYNRAYAFHKFAALNNGKPFPYRYDIRNRLNFVLAHKINKSVEVFSTWEFGSGSPVTLSSTVYDGEKDIGEETGFLEDFFGIYQPVKDPEKATYYSGINNFRLPVYHRLDLSVSFIKDKKWGQREWNISLYNVYNRNNIFYLFYQVNESTSHISDKGSYKNFSPFGILPSISYRFKIS